MFSSRKAFLIAQPQSSAFVVMKLMELDLKLIQDPSAFRTVWLPPVISNYKTDARKRYYIQFHYSGGLKTSIYIYISISLRGDNAKKKIYPKNKLIFIFTRTFHIMYIKYEVSVFILVETCYFSAPAFSSKQKLLNV